MCKTIEIDRIPVKSKAKLCPECGSMMVRRTAKKGSGTASQFWGCSAFPKCRMVEVFK